MEEVAFGAEIVAVPFCCISGWLDQDNLISIAFFVI